jgi:hypothetical protein
MGALIPNDHDKDVSRRLNAQFSEPHLTNLRRRVNRPGSTEPHFFSDPANARHLARISHRLKIHPHEPPSPTPAELRARWQYFLQRLLTDPVSAAQDGTTVAEVIRKALQVFVVTDDPQCTAITFETIPGNLPTGIDYRANITPNPNAPRPANYVAHIQLVCRKEIADDVAADDPDADNGEVPPAQPNL